MSNIERSSTSAVESKNHEDYLDDLRMFIAQHGETTLYEARNELAKSKSVGTIANHFDALERLGEIIVYRREKGGRGKIWYGLTGKGFYTALIGFPELQQDFAAFALRWYDHDRFRTQEQGAGKIDIRPHLADKKKAEALKELFLRTGKAGLPLLKLFEKPLPDKKLQKLALEGAALQYLSAIGRLSQKSLEVLYLGIPEMRAVFDAGFDNLVLRLEELKSWLTKLRQKARDLEAKQSI